MSRTLTSDRVMKHDFLSHDTGRTDLFPFLELEVESYLRPRSYRFGSIRLRSDHDFAKTSGGL